MKSAKERFQIYTDFWFGVASAGAQGLADVKDALKNGDKPDKLNGAIANGISAVMAAGSTALKRVANEADLVRRQVDSEKPGPPADDDSGGGGSLTGAAMDRKLAGIEQQLAELRRDGSRRHGHDGTKTSGDPAAERFGAEPGSREHQVQR